MLQILSAFLFLSGNCHDTISQYSTKSLWSYYENFYHILMPFVLIGVCYYFIPRLLARLLEYKKAKNAWRWISDHFKWCFGFVFGCGFILYFIGYSHNIEGCNCLTYFFSVFQSGGRALLSSLSMFVFETDLIEVEEAYHHNIIYLSIFALIHILGVLISTHFIIRLLGTRLIAKFRISNFLKSEKKSKTPKELFIFWGINDESITLGKSIFNYRKAKGTIEKLKLLFVETPSEKELEIKEYSFSQFLSSSLHNNSEEDSIKEIDGILLYPKWRLVEIEKEFSGEDAKIFKKLGLSELFELCNLQNNVHFFFLSDDEQKNIQDTLIIQEIFKGKITDNELHLYCKSRDNYANRAIIDAEGLFVTKLIDDAALSIKVLKEMQNNKIPSHPINYVKTDAMTGTVESPFTALIIGFGTAGQDALRFLYEYGVFVKSPSELSPFKCYVIDKDMKNIKGQFIREVPALDSDYIKRAKQTIQELWPDKQLESLRNNIVFLNYDWNSSGFKKRLTNDVLNELNYVVIATGNDKNNTTIAAELYEYVKRNRKNEFRNFHIFVRVYDKENEKHMDAISKFYKKIEDKDVITIFGKQKEIYSYQNIIEDEEAEKHAREFFETYLKIAGYNDSWAKREQRIKDKNTEYNQRLKDVHQRSQDYSNVLHKYTKLKLCKYTEENMPYMKDFSFDINTYPEKDKQRMTCYRNLSELEHLRWNAAHYMAGFVYAVDKDFRKKTHPLLKPFNQLEPDSKDKDDERLKDYATVFTTIELNKKKPIVEFQS